MTPRDARSLDELAALLRKARGAGLKRLAQELADDDRTGVRALLDAAQARERARNREKARLARLYQLEADLAAQGYQVVVGVDEVGRGALAGPLTAGACVLPPSPRLLHLNDSKQLTPAKREELAEQIREIAVCWSVAHVTAAELDSLGMTAALKRAVGRALAGLDLEPDHVVVDGLPMRVYEPETAVVGGDGKVASIAAASILAKVTRDRLMVEMSEQFPAYRFHENKGYSTADHIHALTTCGMCDQHRRSFTYGGGTERLF